MVIEVETFSSGISWKRARMSSTVSMATPTLPTHGHRVVGVVAHLRGEIEGDRQSALPFLQEHSEALIGLPSGSKTRTGASSTGGPDIGLNAAGVRILPGSPRVCSRD